MAVKQLVGVFLVRVVVLTENKIFKVTVFINYRQGIKLVVPYNIICLFKRCILRAHYKGGKRGHKVLNAGILCHTAHSVIAACNYAKQLAVRQTVRRYGYC